MRHGWRVIWMFAIFLLTACVQDRMQPEVSEGSVAGQVTIPFEVMGPDVSGAPATRTILLGEDTPLDSLYVAVFGGSGYLKEYVKAQQLSRIADTTYVDAQGIPHTVARYGFQVTLTLAESDRVLHFLGNGPSTLSFGYADAVLPPLLTSVGGRGYWQMKTLKGIHARKSTTEYTDSKGRTVLPGDYIDKYNNKITDGKGYVPDPALVDSLRSIPLIKNWAKVTLKTNPDSSYFRPVSFAAVNVPARGTLVPHSAATDFIANYQNYPFETLKSLGYPANLPVGSAFDTSIPSADDFRDHTNGVADATAEDGAVYLYERPVPSSDMAPSSVIVYGYFYGNPDDPTTVPGYYYYKIDLMEGSQYYPIYRNFQYEINILKILSQGHHSPAAAAAAAGSADVSADISASHLADISDGTRRLIISPWLAHTFTNKVTDGLIAAYFMDDIVGLNVNMDPEAVTVERLPMSYGEPNVIDSVWIDPPLTTSGSEGWRNIHFTTADKGTTAHTQTMRVTGTHAGERLYRDVVITLMPLQEMIVRCQSRIAAVKGTYQCVEIVIPDGLEDSMFPLAFQIEPDQLTLTPDGTKVNNNLPVVFGPSISENPDLAGKTSFHFERSLSWDEYRSLQTERDENNRTWRVLPCHFKTNCDNSTSTVWVRNDDYFIPAHTSFSSLGGMTFRNLKITNPIKREENYTVSVHFDVDTDPVNLTYPDDYPVITLEAYQMEPVTEGVIPVSGLAGTYRFKPSSSSVDLDFVTTTRDGDLRLNLSAEDYESQTLRSHFFQDFGFVDGHKLWKTNAWSNVACGYLNSDKNKTILFGYFDDEEAPNVEINLRDLSGLTRLTPSSYPWTPSGPLRTNALPTYHELEFRTLTDKVHVEPVSFILSANGYVEETIRANRFEGNIMTQDQISTSKVFKPGNTYGFSVTTPSFKIEQNVNSGTPQEGPIP